MTEDTIGEGDRSRPLISIITPLLNGERYLTECIESVVRQKYNNFEHLVVDGGSTDRSIDIIENYAASTEGRVRLVKVPGSNACQAWNMGLEEATGEYIGWLGADDRFKGDAFLSLLEILRVNPREKFIYGGADIIDDAGLVVGRYATKDFVTERAIGAAGNFAAAVSVFFSAKLIKEVGLLRTDVNACDYDFFLRCGLSHPPLRVPDVFSEYRIHKGGITGSSGHEIYPAEFFRIALDHGGGYFCPAARKYYGHLLRRTGLVRWLGKIGRNRERTRLKDGLKRGDRVAVFGAAISGQACCGELEKMGVSVSFFLDNQPPPKASFLGRPVFRPEEIDGSNKAVDAVVLAAGGRKADMRNQLKNIGFPGRIFVWNQE